MRKVAYILGYTGGIGAFIVSILNIVVFDTFYSNQPTKLIKYTLIGAYIPIILSIIILLSLYKLDFTQIYSCSILLILGCVTLIFPGTLNYILRLFYNPRYRMRPLNYIGQYISYSITEYFPLILVIIAAILFLCIIYKNSKNV